MKIKFVVRWVWVFWNDTSLTSLYLISSYIYTTHPFPMKNWTQLTHVQAKASTSILELLEHIEKRIQKLIGDSRISNKYFATMQCGNFQNICRYDTFFMTGTFFCDQVDSEAQNSLQRKLVLWNNVPVKLFSLSYNIEDLSSITAKTNPSFLFLTTLFPSAGSSTDYYS